MDKKEFVEIVVKKLTLRYGERLHTELGHVNQTELFVAVFLSPQCADKQINRITPPLFKKFKSFEDYADSNTRTLMRYLSGVNYYKTKARNLKKSAKMIVEDYGGRVPRKLNQLMELPGVGRKVANVILNEGFDINEGIAIDTHCITVARRLHLSRHKNADKIEQDLMKKIPKKDWQSVSNLFIALGKDTCKARVKECDRCVLKDICPSSSVKN